MAFVYGRFGRGAEAKSAPRARMHDDLQGWTQVPADRAGPDDCHRLGIRSATFTVNTTDDDVDVAPGDGICATAGGTCTLRAAIQETNYLPGSDVIVLPAGHYLLTIPWKEDAGAAGNLDIWDNLRI